MVLDTEQPQLFATDWRGNAINEGTRILWKNGSWGIGVVEKIRFEYYSGYRFDVLWEERDGWDKDRVGKVGRGISPEYCTVWPAQDEQEQ